MTKPASPTITLSPTPLEYLDPKITAELDAHASNIGLFLKGQAKGAAEQFGYAYLAGREMLLAKPKVPHGNTGDRNASFKSWLAIQFPKLSYRTAARQMEFADCISASLADKPKLSSRLCLDNGRTKLSVKNRSAILETVPLIMDGKAMLRFMRDSHLLRDPEKAQHHKRKKLSPDQAREAKSKQAHKLWAGLLSDLNLALKVRSYLDNDTKRTALDQLVTATTTLRADLTHARTN